MVCGNNCLLYQITHIRTGTTKDYLTLTHDQPVTIACMALRVNLLDDWRISKACRCPVHFIAPTKPLPLKVKAGPESLNKARLKFIEEYTQQRLKESNTDSLTSNKDVPQWTVRFPWLLMGLYHIKSQRWLLQLHDCPLNAEWI